MFIKKLSFTEKFSGWCLEESTFEQLTLLVGVSGVGKTRILDAIRTLKMMASGESLNGIKWKIIFSSEDGKDITWAGETEYVENIFDRRQIPVPFYKDKESKNNFIINNEKLEINNEPVCERNTNGEIFLNGHKVVKLDRTLSIIHLLKEEDDISVIYKEFQKINFVNKNVSGMILSTIISDDDPKDIETICNSYELSLTYKLFLAYQHCEETFKAIKKDFINIFSFVEDIRFEQPKALENFKKKQAPEIRVLQIKERNNDNWICIWDISSGMLKVLVLISYLYLEPKGCVFLIDEFENSFGVNCLSEVTSILLKDNDKQLIMTSHHPYIIHNIDPKQWRLVTRKQHIVRVIPIDDKISKTSQHDRFIQLINLPVYIDEGILS